MSAAREMSDERLLELTRSVTVDATDRYAPAAEAVIKELIGAVLADRDRIEQLENERTAHRAVDFHDQALEWRHVRDACERCAGSGLRWYASTATWRGGMGGAAMSRDVCDRCWGTGDRYRSGVDLRVLRDEERDRVAKAAVTRLTDAVGAQFNSCVGNVNEIALALRKFAGGRHIHFQTATLAEALAEVLERAMGVKR